MKKTNLPTTAQMDIWAIKNAPKLEDQDKKQWAEVQQLVRDLLVDGTHFLYMVENMEVDEAEICEIFEECMKRDLIDHADCNLIVYQLCKQRCKFVNEIRGYLP